MSRTFARRPVRPAAARAVSLVRVGAPLVAAALVLSACTPTGTSAERQAARSSAASAVSAVAEDRPDVVSTGTGGPGSVTVSVSGTVSGAANIATPVTCTTGRLYSATATGAAEGYSVTLTVTARGYTGPGGYPATIALALVTPDGAVNGLAPIQEASLTDTGGSLSYTGQAPRGSVTGSISWACS